MGKFAVDGLVVEAEREAVGAVPPYNAAQFGGGDVGAEGAGGEAEREFDGVTAVNDGAAAVG